MNSLESAQIQPFPQLIGTLEELCQRGLTGKLFITTSQNHTASISIAKGKICSLQYRILKSLRALEEIKKIEAAKYRFSLEDVIRIDESLPPTELLIEALGGKFPLTSSQQKDTAQSSDQSVSSFNATEIQKVELVLTRFIGPIAHHVCQLASRKAKTRAELIELICQKISDQQTKQKFRQALKDNSFN